MKKRFLVMGVLIAACFMIVLTGYLNKENGAKQENSSDNSKKATYYITVSGEINEPGFISFGGYDMNVYEDKASNPCGDCDRQPAHLYKGADAKTVVQAMKDSIDRENYMWDVQEVTDSSITLIEKEAGKSKDPGTPETLKGLTITGVYTPASK